MLLLFLQAKDINHTEPDNLPDYTTHFLLKFKDGTFNPLVLDIFRILTLLTIDCCSTVLTFKKLLLSRQVGGSLYKVLSLPQLIVRLEEKFTFFSIVEFQTSLHISAVVENDAAFTKLENWEYIYQTQWKASK